MEKVLVVDNDRLILSFMSDLLKEEGYQVATAEDGLSALDLIESWQPDIFFIDLIMPNIAGDQLCRIIRRSPEYKKAFIVILSAVASETDIFDVDAIGADACIAKGPMDKMAQHVRRTLSIAHKKQPAPADDERIFGIEDVYPRNISRELVIDNQHFEIVLASIREGVFEITSDRRIVYANPTATVLTGHLLEDLLASDFVSLFHRDDQPTVSEFLNLPPIADQEHVLDTPVHLYHRLVKLGYLPLVGGETKNLIIMHDVTKEKLREVQLIEAQKMEAIGTLAAGIAHDFNNLLMALQGNTSLLLLDIDEDHDHFDKLKNIEKQIRQASKLTGQLLGYARKGRYEIKPIEINQVVAETLDTFCRTQKQLTLHIDICEEDTQIEGDKGQVQQALLNLYVNAADAMPKGGTLWVQSQVVEHTTMTGKVYKPKGGSYVRLTIRDTGVGMTPEIMERIFDPFFTTKEMGRGTGLGLASVYGIIKGHGGYIDVESKEGQGTTFYLYLPCIKREAEEAPSLDADSVSMMLSEKGETILLVDDEDVIREVGKDMLTAMGYNVMLATDGRRAIEIYRRHKDEIHLVLLDMVMPRLSGQQVYKRLRELDPNVKVLLSSGYSLDSEAAEIMDQGCNGFIQKPFNINALSKALRSIIDPVADQEIELGAT
jgi:signal transduction histidine kinase